MPEIVKDSNVGDRICLARMTPLVEKVGKIEKVLFSQNGDNMITKVSKNTDFREDTGDILASMDKRISSFSKKGAAFLISIILLLLANLLRGVGGLP